MNSPLIPRADLFGNPVRYGTRIDPTGTMLAWIAPEEGVNNIWVAPRDDLDAAYCLTHDRGRGIHSLAWTHHPSTILFVQDTAGDENWHVHAVTLDGAVCDLTPLPGIKASIASISRDIPDRIAVLINARDPRFHDVYHVELATGVLHLIEENPGFLEIALDTWLMPRVALRPRPDGGADVMRRTGSGWEEWFGYEPDDARMSRPIALSRDGQTLFLIDSRDRDTGALLAQPMDGGVPVVLAEHPEVEIDGYLGDHETEWPIAFVFTGLRRKHVPMGDLMRADIELLERADIGEYGISSRSDDDRWWTITTDRDTAPSSSWLLDRKTRTLSFLFSARPGLERYELATSWPVSIRARDGLNLVSYLTLPVGHGLNGEERLEADPLALVLVVHGGPWLRDSFGYDGEHQWLANRGYAVLAVNFRGSTGFGKAFRAAGDREWGRRMDDDLLDAVSWAIEHGVADPARIAIMGGSYGGYAVLAGMTRSPEVYACGVDIVGPSSLETLMGSIPPYWEAQRLMFYRAVGDPRTTDGLALLRERSPLHSADRIVRPLMIGQGANDPRVLQAESDQMVEALKANNVPVTYIVYPDEGHGFVRPPNRMSFNAVVESFLASHLGGRYEAPTPGEFEGTTMDVRADDRGLAAEFSMAEVR